MPERSRVRRDALAILEQIPDWRLAPARWDIVGRLLEAVEMATSSDDLEELEAVTASLEHLGPVRITRLGAVPAEPPPLPVRERVSALVHRLGGGAARVDSGRGDS